MSDPPPVHLSPSHQDVIGKSSSVETIVQLSFCLKWLMADLYLGSQLDEVLDPKASLVVGDQELLLQGVILVDGVAQVGVVAMEEGCPTRITVVLVVAAEDTMSSHLGTVPGVEHNVLLLPRLWDNPPNLADWADLQLTAGCKLQKSFRGG